MTYENSVNDEYSVHNVCQFGAKPHHQISQLCVLLTYLIDPEKLMRTL